jgi:hypothetical protein
VNDARCRVSGQDGPQCTDQAGVNLDGDDACARLQQGEGEAAQAGTDLDDEVLLADASVTHNLADGVWVDDEVLPQALVRRELVLV